MTTEPTNPPTSACEELLGKPKYQVSKVPKNGAGKCSHDHLSVNSIGYDNIIPDCFCNSYAENQRP